MLKNLKGGDEYMATELKAVINLQDNFSAQIKNVIQSTDTFKESVKKAKDELDKLSNGKYEATIKTKDEATKKLTETRKALDSIKTNVAISVAYKDKATEGVTKIKNEVKKLVSTPYSIVISAVDKTKSVISSITDSIFNLKTLAMGIVFGSATKAGYDWTIGNASSNEDYLATLQTVLHSEDKGKEALKWAYSNAASTPFDAEEVVSGVTMLATSGLDYEKYLNPLGDAAAAMNKPIEQAIFAMSKLASGQYGVAVDMFRDFGVSNQDWVNAGASFDGTGSLQVDNTQQAIDMVTGIIQSKYGGLMDKKSGTASGMLSNMGDTIAAMGRGLAGIDDEGMMIEGGLFDNFKKQLANIAPLLEQIQSSDAFKTLQTQIGELATAGGDKLTKFLEGFKDPEQIEKYKESFNNFVDAVKEGASTLKDLGSIAKSILDALKPVIDLVVAHPKLFAGLFIGFEGAKGASSIISSFKGIASGVKDVISFGSKAGSSLGKAFTTVKPLITGFGKDFGTAFSNIANTARIYIGVIGSVIQKNLVSAFKTGGTAIINVGKSIGTGLSSAFKLVGTVASTLGKTVINVGKLMATGLSSSFKLIGTLASSFGKSLLNVFKVLGTGIISVMKPVFAFLMANPIVLVITAIIAVVILLYEAWKHNWGGIQEKTKAVVDFVKEKVAGIVDVFNSVVEKAKGFAENIKNIWQGIKDFFAHPIQGTIDFVQNITGNGKSSEEPAKNALGTSYWRGGPTWVGEKGPELVDLPAGSNISSNWNSMKALNQTPVKVDVVIQGNVIGNEEYAEYIGESVAYKINTLLATNM